MNLIDTEIPSTGAHTGAQTPMTSQDDQDPEECFAVKLQSKYSLIKGAQEAHLHNEIELMSQMDHPLILKMKGVA